MVKGKRAPAQVWTEDKKKAAVEGRYYIKLGDKRGTLLLSGAAQKWKADPTFTYVPSLRVAGTPADIERALLALGNTAAEVRAALASGYTAASAASALKAAYDAEVDSLKASGGKKGSKKATSSVVNAGTSIAAYAAMVESAAVEGRSPRGRSPKKARKSASKSPKKARKSASKSPKKARKSASKSPKKSPKKARKAAASPKGKRGAKPLADKIAALTEGKVMDVSKLHADGSGAKVISEPGAKSKKVLIAGTRIVSDHKNGVKAAAKMLGDESLVDRFEAARKSAKPAKSPKASPAKALPMSPVSSPIGVPSLPTVGSSPRGTLPTVRIPTIGSPKRSPRL